MNRVEPPYDVKEALVFTQKMAQLSKALWEINREGLAAMAQTV